MQPIKRVGCRQNQDIRKKPSQGEQVFVSLKFQRFRHPTDLRENPFAVRHAAGAQKPPAHAENPCFFAGRQPKTSNLARQFGHSPPVRVDLCRAVPDQAHRRLGLENARDGA